MTNAAAEKIAETTTVAAEQSLSAEERKFLDRMRSRVKRIIPAFPALMIGV